jgi:tRNA G18 (ribose-2'-O)-methylase SpoU
MPNIIEITDFNAPQLDVYARLNEAQLLHYFEPKEGVFIAESPNVVLRALNAGYMPLSLLVEQKHIEGQAEEVITCCTKYCSDLPIYTAPFDVLTSLTGFELTRGLLCAMRRRPLPSVEELCANARRIAVLENVVNPTNIGAIFRSAAALNMDAVLLTPGCSDPLYRRAARVSMGTVFQIPWTYFDEKNSAWPDAGLPLLHQLGFKTAAMALSDEAVSIDNPRLMSEEKLAVVLGTEGDGLCAKTIADCDYTVCIPMSHGVDSLNVAAASAVAFWQLGR